MLILGIYIHNKIWGGVWTQKKKKIIHVLIVLILSGMQKKRQNTTIVLNRQNTTVVLNTGIRREIKCSNLLSNTWRPRITTFLKLT